MGSSYPAQAQTARDSNGYFRGEDCRACHENIRDASNKFDLPPSGPAKKYDVIIVGGGPSGLAAGYFLRDLNVLILEKETRAGGHSRREWWDGQPYSAAAVYMGKPDGVVAKTLRELNLAPVKIPDPMDAFAANGRIVPDPWGSGIGEMAASEPDKSSFRQIVEDVQAMSRRGIFDQGPQKSPEAARYEAMTYWDFLMPRYGAAVARWADRMAADWYGAGARKVSAWMGLLSMFGEKEDNYTFEGGLGAVSEAIESALPGKILTGALVVHVRSEKDGVHVVYVKDGAPHRVLAKAVVMATPSHVTRKIVQGLPPEKARALSRVHFSAYVVGIIRFKKPVWEKSYGLWDADTMFTELTFHDWPFKDKKTAAGPQIAAAYIPMGSKSARAKLLNMPDEELKKRVLPDLDKILPGSSKEVDEIRFIRWGHAMPVFGPGYATRIKPILQKPAGDIFFAGEDVEMPFIEGALIAADNAARGVRNFLAP